jgi:hypothetical protein
MLPYTIAQLVTEVPGKLHRTETDSIEVPELVNAPLKRSGALEVEDKGDIAGTNPVGQVGTVFDKGNHPLRSRSLLEKDIYVFQGRFEIPPRIVRMRIGVAADSIDTNIDPITYQPGGDRIPDGTLLPERASMEKLIDITVTFHYNGLLENLI